MSFEWVRGTCPRCGADQVLHHVIGMPVREVYDSSPAWVLWEGCTGPGPDRECLGCAHSWWSHDVGFAEEEDDEYSPPLRVVGAVIIDRDRTLAARRAPGKSAAGLWEFPGGKVEPGEEPRDALVREVREELGVAVHLGAEVAAADPEGWVLANGARMRVFFGALEDPAAEPRPLQDHDLLVWTPLTLEDLHALAWIPADRPIVDALLARVAARDTGL